MTYIFDHFFFFFQAEDGIRDVAVTGFQTCALPISRWPKRGPYACGTRAAGPYGPPSTPARAAHPSVPVPPPARRYASAMSEDPRPARGAKWTKRPRRWNATSVASSTPSSTLCVASTSTRPPPGAPPPRSSPSSARSSAAAARSSPVNGSSSSRKPGSGIPGLAVAPRSARPPSRATTCPRPSPKACRRPSAESIDAGGEVFQVERLDEIPRVAEVQHVDERFHAHVRGRHDHRERRLRLADLLQQGDPVGVGQSQIEHQHFGAELVHLAASLGPAGGECQVIAFGEESLVGPPQRRLILDEQHFAPRAEGGRPHGGPIYAGPPRRLRSAQLGPLSSSNRSSSLVSTSRNRSSSLAPRRHTVSRRSAAFR